VSVTVSSAEQHGDIYLLCAHTCRQSYRTDMDTPYVETSI